MQTVIRVNWHRQGGKWYTKQDLKIPTSLKPGGRSTKFPLDASKDALYEYILNHQTVLRTGWHTDTWYMHVTVLEQEEADCRFFERLYKINLH